MLDRVRQRGRPRGGSSSAVEQRTHNPLGRRFESDLPHQGRGTTAPPHRGTSGAEATRRGSGRITGHGPRDGGVGPSTSRSLPEEQLIEPGSTAAADAHAALRAAAAALARGDHADRAGPPRSGPGHQLVVPDLARNLDALAAIMRASGIEPVATTRTGREFAALLARITGVAALARDVAGIDDHDGHRPRRTTSSAVGTPDD